MPDNTNNLMTVKMLALAFGGSCIGEVQTAQDQKLLGMKAFVPFSAPGELVTAEVTAQHTRHLEARLIEVIKPAATRVTPACPYFLKCGGCDYQHIAIEAQREAKRQMVETALLRQNKLLVDQGVSLIGKDLPAWNYRRRISLHLDPAGQLGFYKAGSGEVVDIAQCLIASEALNQILTKLKKIAKQLAKNFAGIVLEEQNQPYVLLKLKNDQTFPCESFSCLAEFNNLTIERQSQVIYARENGQELKSGFPVGHFSQVNSAANHVLVQYISNQIQSRKLTELFAGSGNFTLALALKGVTVKAVEADSRLVELGQRLASQSKCTDKIDFICSTCEKYVRRNSLDQVLLLDPPRSGAKEVIPFIKTANVKQIEYVSCNLPTLARDLRILAQSGYKIMKVAVLDMFPHTGHVEMVASLRA